MLSMGRWVCYIKDNKLVIWFQGMYLWDKYKYVFELTPQGKLEAAKFIKKQFGDVFGHVESGLDLVRAQDPELAGELEALVCALMLLE